MRQARHSPPPSRPVDRADLLGARAAVGDRGVADVGDGLAMRCSGRKEEEVKDAPKRRPERTITPHSTRACTGWTSRDGTRAALQHAGGHRRGADCRSASSCARSACGAAEQLRPAGARQPCVSDATAIASDCAERRPRARRARAVVSPRGLKLHLQGARAARGEGGRDLAQQRRAGRCSAADVVGDAENRRCWSRRSSPCWSGNGRHRRELVLLVR